MNINQEQRGINTMKRNTTRALLGAGVGIIALGVACGTAQAQVSVKSMTIDGGPLGPLNISGGFDADL